MDGAHRHAGVDTTQRPRTIRTQGRSTAPQRATPPAAKPKARAKAKADWYLLFPNPVVAESLLDRLINTSHQVIMNGPSHRPNKRPKNPTDKPAKPTIT